MDGNIKLRMRVLRLLAVGLMAAASLGLISLKAQESNDGRGRGSWMGMGSGGSPVAGSITSISAPNLMVRTPEGDLYRVTFSVNTRFVKDRQPVKSTDLKVGDTVVAVGVIDAKAKTVAAAFIAELDAEQAKQIREAQNNYGKTWLGGKVSTIDETRLTIIGVDGKTASFVVDENTSFRKRKASITLADVKVGDQVRVLGSVKNQTFMASRLSVFEPRTEGEPSR